ncbi:hypothetical protein LPJ61_005966 [Coemansia biformis]|uniref:Uncharacterized protein n=1 Tax=Coemansia biformis TaxID=1286918 RepID=A0A9W8CQT5_9FUNG|nr:hypothetical protein LPJ61_005966 [Coemansia biformis]
MVICHRPLKCTNNNCLAPVNGVESDDGVECDNGMECDGGKECDDSAEHAPLPWKHQRLWNRDLAAVLNFRHILFSLRDHGAIPLWFQHVAHSSNNYGNNNDSDSNILLSMLLGRGIAAGCSAAAAERGTWLSAKARGKLPASDSDFEIDSDSDSDVPLSVLLSRGMAAAESSSRGEARLSAKARGKLPASDSDSDSDSGRAQPLAKRRRRAQSP